MKAVGTAKYANHAKTDRIGEQDGFTQWENALFDSTSFPFAVLSPSNPSRVSAAFSHDAFDLRFRVMAEVDQQAEFQARRLEVVLNLRAVLVSQFRHGFQFHDDLVVADEVGLVFRAQRTVFVFQSQRHLGHEGNALQAQFDLQALLVNGFEETAALFPVNLETRPHNLVAFNFEQWIGIHGEGG